MRVQLDFTGYGMGNWAASGVTGEASRDNSRFTRFKFEYIILVQKPSSMAQVFFTIIHGWPLTLPTPLKGMTEKWNIHIFFELRAKSEVLRTRGRVFMPFRQRC